MGGYARTVVLLRLVVVLVWIAAAVAAWAILPGLGGSSTAPLGDIVATDAPSIQAQQRALELFGATVGTDTAIVQRNPRGLTDAELEAHLRAARSVRQPGLKAAIPVPNAEVEGVRWRERDTTVVTFLFLSPDLNLQERTDTARRYAQRLERAPGSTIGITGAGPARLEQFEQIESALPLVTVATLAVILLIVALYFRSVGAPLVTLLTAAVAYAVAVRVLGWCSERAEVTAPSEIEPVLVVLLLGLVTDYTIFFMADARRRLLRGEPRLGAARAATARIAPIVFTAGIVVAGGAVSLLAGRTEFFRVFGPGLALAALVVTLVCVTFVPAVLALLGPRLFGRRVREAVPDADEEPGAVAADLGAAGPARRERWRLRTSGALGSLRASRSHAREEGGRVLPALGARLLSTRPVALVLALVCVAGLAFAALPARNADLDVSYVPSLPRDSEERRAADAAARGFGPGVLAPTDVIVEHEGLVRSLPALVELQRLISAEAGVATVIGPAQPAGTPLEGLVVSKDGGAARYAVLFGSEPTGTEAIDDLEQLRDRMPALLREAGLPGDARVAFAGETALASETVASLEGDLGRIALAMFVLAFGLLACFLRAFLAPVLLIFGSALAFAASLGLTSLLLPGGDFVFYVPLVAGVLLIALGSDYNVFIAGRIRDELRRRRLREAIAVAAPAASRAITVAGLTLAATFALLALVPLRPFREMALLMTIGVLVDALIVRTILIPSLLALGGRASWWPGRPQRPVSTRAFLAGVSARSGLGETHAWEATLATLQTLAERIPPRESHEVAVQLPPGLAGPLKRAEGAAEPFACDEFVTRVAQRTRIGRDEARANARAVIATLVAALPETEVDYVRAALSDDYRGLFGDAVAVDRARTGPALEPSGSVPAAP